MKEKFYKVGDLFETTYGGPVVVIDIESSLRVTVEFVNSAYRKIVQASKLKSGNIKDDTLINYHVGQSFKNNEGREYEILEIVSYKELIIKFKETGYQTKIQANKLKTGIVRDRLVPALYGIGINDMPNLLRGTEEYQCFRNWMWIFTRCYSETYHVNQPYYIGCSVGAEWHKLSNFYKWWKVNYVKDWALDKDMLSPKDGKIYSENTCCFIPAYINSAFNKCISKSKYALGVSKTRQVRLSPYEARLLDNTIKCFKTVEEAHRCWQDSKINHSYALIERYKSEEKWRQDVVDVLIAKVNQLEEDYRNNRITKMLDS